jgi:Mn-dependent DtxR family transcriptional regulator
MRESGEMYLETILILEQEKDVVRAIDVAEHMGYSKPSVSRALGKLKADGCILVDPDGHISFLPKGRAVAEKIYERHIVLSTLLTSLGVDEKTALDDACRVEHVISDETFEAIKRSIRRNV